MRNRVIKAILTAAFFSMWILMAVFALTGCQTIEWCMKDGIPVPWQAWVMLVTVAVWCVIAVNIPAQRIEDMKRFLTKLTEE